MGKRSMYRPHDDILRKSRQAVIRFDEQIECITGAFEGGESTTDGGPQQHAILPPSESIVTAKQQDHDRQFCRLLYDAR